jgi:hypothetical protein
MQNGTELGYNHGKRVQDPNVQTDHISDQAMLEVSHGSCASPPSDHCLCSLPAKMFLPLHDQQGIRRVPKK